MEGAKFYDDSFFNNEVYAKIGGVPVEELNHLELEFVFLIGFSLVIAPEEYQRIHNDLFRHCRMICHSCRRFVWRGIMQVLSVSPICNVPGLPIPFAIRLIVSPTTKSQRLACRMYYVSARVLHKHYKLEASRTSFLRSHGCGDGKPSALHDQAILSC